MDEIEKGMRKVQEYLGMTTMPVGIKIITQSDATDNTCYQKTDGKESFCRYVREAATGKAFLMRREDLGCNKAEIVLGFREPRFGNLEPRIHEKIHGLRIGPVADADAVMLVLNPEQGMTLSNILPGILVSFKRNRTVCGEGLAAVHNNGQPTMSLLCIGARTDGDFRPDELLVTLPYKTFLELPARMSKFSSFSRQAVDALKERFGKRIGGERERRQN